MNENLKNETKKELLSIARYYGISISGSEKKQELISLLSSKLKKNDYRKYKKKVQTANPENIVKSAASWFPFKRVVWSFLFVIIGSFIIHVSYHIQHWVEKPWNIWLNFFKDSVILCILFIILFLIYGYVIPFLRTLNNHVREGDFWFMKLSNISSYEPGQLVILRISVFMMNCLGGITILVGFFSAVFCLVIASSAVFSFFIELIMANDPRAFVSLVMMLVGTFSLSSLNFGFAIGSVVTKRETYIYLYRNFYLLHDPYDKRKYFENIILRFIKTMYFGRISKSAKSLSKNLFKKITAYFSHILLNLFDSDVVYETFYQKLHRIVISEDYPELLNYLKQVDAKAKKQKGYSEQIELFKAERKKFGDSNPIELANSLSKVKFGWSGDEPLKNRIYVFIDTTWMGKIIFAGFVFFLIAVLWYFGALNPILARSGLNQTEAIKFAVNVFS